MKTPIIVLLLATLLMNETILFDFTKTASLQRWNIVDDVVMGGRSDGNLSINAAGHGVFSGRVSLENNGGFSSIRYRTEQQDVNAFSKVVLRVKGDGQQYQFRVKTSRNDYFSYTTPFTTNGSWQTIEIPFTTLAPAFRGRKLRMDTYPGEQLEEVALLIGNKEAVDFILLIDKISLQ